MDTEMESNLKGFAGKESAKTEKIMRTTRREQEEELLKLPV